MKPILKWTGTKEAATSLLLPFVPDSFRTYFEPFFGSGALYFALNTEYGYANDHCPELITMYRLVQDGNGKLMRYYEAAIGAWRNMDAVYDRLKDNLYELYWRKQNRVFGDYLSFVHSATNLVRKIDYEEVFPIHFSNEEVFRMETRHRIIHHILQMQDRQDLSEQTISGNLHTALKDAVYSYFQQLYNEPGVKDSEKSAFLMFLMGYSMGTRFVYDDVGEFRVPYGGKWMNKVSQADRLNVLKSDDFRRKMEKTHFSAMEFHRFFGHYVPQEGDFIYLDPPDDGAVGACGNCVFTVAEHTRLATYLLNGCPAKWMLTVHRHKFVNQLYGHKGLDIRPLKEGGNLLVIRNYT